MEKAQAQLGLKGLAWAGLGLEAQAFASLVGGDASKRKPPPLSRNPYRLLCLNMFFRVLRQQSSA